MRIKLILLFVGALILVIPCLAQDSLPVKVRMLKDNTNLRAKPALNVEVVGQVSADQELTAKSMDAEWVEVVAPTNVDFWVMSDYFKDGTVVCRQTVNVRAGPGINFSVVGQLSNGARVDVRGSHQDWIKVAPPAGCSLWVSRPLVEIVPAVQSPPAKLPALKPRISDTAMPRSSPVKSGAESRQAQPEPIKQEKEVKEAPKTAVIAVQPLPAQTGATSAVEEAKTVGIKPPPDLDLIPDIGQGQMRQYEGVLKSRNFLARSPSGFRLVAEDENGQTHTVCFVKGNRAQLDALIFRHLVVYGRQYWIHRCREPVLVPEKIIIK